MSIAIHSQDSDDNDEKETKSSKKSSKPKTTKTASGECEGMEGGALTNISSGSKRITKQDISSSSLGRQTPAEERAAKKRQNKQLPKKVKRVSRQDDEEDESDAEVTTQGDKCSADSPIKQTSKKVMSRKAEIP